MPTKRKCTKNIPFNTAEKNLIQINNKISIASDYSSKEKEDNSSLKLSLCPSHISEESEAKNYDEFAIDCFYQNNDNLSIEIRKNEARNNCLSIAWKAIKRTFRDNCFTPFMFQRIQNSIKRLLSPSFTQNNIKILGSESMVEIVIEELLSANLVIHPLSKFRLHWDLKIMTMLVVNLFVLPLDIAFFTDTDTWVYLHIISDTLCILDILISFRTGYVKNVRNEFVLDELKIIRNYLRTWFVIDLISSLPLHYVILEIYGKRNTFPLGIKSASHALKFVRLLKLLTILKLLRLSRVIRSFLQYEELYRITTSLMRYIKLISMMLIVAHWNGCLHFMIPMLQGFPEGCWVELCQLKNEAWYTQYGWAIFKTLSHMLCIGYGRFIPVLLSEALVTNFTMVSGATFYALFIASAMAHMIQNDNSKDSYLEKVKYIEEFLMHENVPDQIKDRVDTYMNQKYTDGRYFNEDYVISELSKPIKDDIILFKYRDIIKKVAILRNGNPGVVLSILGMISSDVFLAGDTIIKEGNKDSQLFFVCNGTLDIQIQNKCVATISDGAVFG